MTVLWITVAGSVGAIARFVLDGVVRQRWKSVFPWATTIINVTGSLVLGFVTGLIVFRGAPSELQQIVGIGFCGGYTTFSTASVETVRLLQRRKYLLGVINGAGTLSATVTAGAAGLALASL